MKPTAVKRSASPAPRRGTGRQEKPAAVAAAGTMGRPSSFSSPPILSRLFHFLLSLAPLFFLSSSHPTPVPDVSVENPIVQLTASVSDGNLNERIRVCGTSRLNWKSYANSLYVLVKASEEMPHRHYGNVGICVHRNASIGIGQCKDDDWRSLQKSEWKYVMSPYDTRFIDVKSRGQVSGSIIVSVEEEFQQWRWICLGAGFVLMFLAPIVSNWVPFYYSSSMALGVLLVILLILFQGMKLLPTGRKNILYLTLYGSVLGVGSYIAHYFSTIVNSILVSFGLSEEMHNPVSVFLLVGIVLAGAALGYWIVRKYVLSKDGTIDVGIAQFVKWAMRIIAVVLILQSSFDALLAVIALGVCWSFCSLISSLGWSSPSALRKGHLKSANLWQQKAWQASGISRHAEFLNRSANMGSGQPIWGSPSSFSRLSISPMTGQTSSTPNRNSTSSMRNRAQSSDFYSSFHKTPTRKFSKMEWEDFTRESTREALADWASTPEVSKWMANNAHRMRLVNDSSSDDTMESSSGSSEETAVDDGGNNGLRLFKWSLGFSA